MLARCMLLRKMRARTRPSKTAHRPCPLFGPPCPSPKPSNLGHSNVYDRRQKLGKEFGQKTAFLDSLGSDNRLRRSRGTFAHSSHAAYYFEYILPLILLLSFSHPNPRWRWFYRWCLTMGSIALFLTFSRSGFLGFCFGAGVTLFLARLRNLLSRQIFTALVMVATIGFLILAPKVYNHLTARPESFRFRFELLETGLDIFMGQPLLGVGLNNSSAVSERFHPKRHQNGSWEVQVIHNHYMILAIETGLIGFILYFGFFGQIMYLAWQGSKASELSLAHCAIGILGALSAIALHNMGDPFGGHTLHAMLWLYAGLILALPRIESLQPHRPRRDTLQPLTAVESRW